MFFMHVVMLVVKICYVISDKEKYISLVVVVKHLDGVFGMFLFFGILKICGFVFVKINPIL